MRFRRHHRRECICRSSLAAKASPILTAAGAILAADFVQSGLTQDDTSVLARLMTMLTDPLVEMRREKEEELVRLPSFENTATVSLSS